MEDNKEPQNENHEGQLSPNFQNSSAANAPRPTDPPPPAPKQAIPVSPQSPPPQVAYAAPASTPAEPTPRPNTPGLMVLQWLTYAFWGWTVLAMSFLTVTVLANFIGGADDGGFTPYAIAAVLVLLPISVGCDVFYSKQEPEKKTGAASIIMVIHAVLFAIFCIGALIAIVISLVQLFTSSSDTTNAQVALYSEIIITILYAAVFLRTLRPVRLVWFRRLFPTLMVIAVGIISVLGIVGPVAHERATRTDRLIEDNLNAIQVSINDYANTYNQLPDTLAAINLDADAKKLVTSNLIQYIPDSKPPSTSTNTRSSSAASTSIQQTTSPKTYYYQLCANYKKSSGDHNGDQATSSYDLTSSDGYSAFILTTSHPAGKFCYKASTTPASL